MALPSSTKKESTIFGKNSDREPNEPQVIEYYPRSSHGRIVRCTYIPILGSQTDSYAILVSKPFWMFGAEMGVNECGVSIGNEAVFTKVKKNETGLLGMDMIRIALERSNTARSALDTITKLIETYGQGGSNSLFRNYLYHNSFLISDRESAWVLETAGEYWAAKEVRDYYSISNILTIHSDYDLCSQGLENKARAKGHWRSLSHLDFAKAFQDTIYSRLGKGADRVEATRDLLKDCEQSFDLPTARSLLRMHNTTDGKYAKGNTGDVCMHSGGFLSPDQTAGSMISTFIERKVVAFATGSSLPCRSVYKPHIVEGSEFVHYTRAAKNYDEKSFWWLLEKVHRSNASSESYSFQSGLENDFETSFLQKLVANDSVDDLVSFTKSCYAKEMDETKLRILNEKTPSQLRHWRKLDKQVEIPS